MRAMAMAEAADVTNNLIPLTPLMAIALLPKALGLNTLVLCALLAPRVAKADRKTAVELGDLTPSVSQRYRNNMAEEPEHQTRLENVFSLFEVHIPRFQGSVHTMTPRTL